MPIIEVKNLSKTYRYHRKEEGLLASVKSLFHREYLETKAVKAISFQIEEGELVGFLGPNGAGKTTTLKMLSGLLYPSSGEARVLNYIPWEKKDDYRRQFSLIMGRKNQLWWDLPAMESFILNKEIYQVEDKPFRNIIEELSILLEVKHLLKVQVRKLSLGERMKMELMAALLHSPKVLFLDEPTIGLDVVSQKRIRDFIKKYNKNTKTTIILTSHYMDDIKELCHRVIIINEGELMYDGNLSKIVSKFTNHKLLTVIFARVVKEENIRKYGEIVEYSPFKATIKVEREMITKVSREFLASFDIEDINIEEVPIEEVIRDIFRNLRNQGKNKR